MRITRKVGGILWRNKKLALIGTGIPVAYGIGRIHGVQDGLTISNYSKSRNKRLKQIKREQVRQRRDNQRNFKQKT